ncbi:MAG: fibrobacter succinogenes major paralogous domain-containing protein [Patescibacteria group bacterium]
MDCKQRKKINNKGFTLVEIIVVVAIIGIISALSLLAYGTIRQKSRDTRRVKDIEQIQTALKLYLYNEGSYPESLDFGGLLLGSTSSTTYMAIIPNNPQPRNDNECTNSDYSYQASSTSTDYRISFCLATAVGSLTPGKKCATSKEILNYECPWACGLPVQYSNGPYDSSGTTRNQGGYYRTVQIGSQCWLKDNLNIGIQVCNSGNNCSTDQADNSIIEKYCYANQPNNCNASGGLYQWPEAVQYLNNASILADWDPIPAGNIQGICPSGWHLPTHNEFNLLERTICTSETCATDFPDNNTATGWQGTDEGSKLSLLTLNGNNSSDFTALMPGYYENSGAFTSLNTETSFWSASTSGSDSWYHRLSTTWGKVDQNHINRDYGYSVRCLLD